MARDTDDRKRECSRCGEVWEVQDGDPGNRELCGRCFEAPMPADLIGCEVDDCTARCIILRGDAIGTVRVRFSVIERV